MLPVLLDQIPPDQKIATVTADGAFDTRKYHDTIATHDAVAIIPARKNFKPWKADTLIAIARNETRRASRRFDRTPSGDDGAATTTEAAPKRRCTVSNCSASNGPRGTSIVRSQSSRPAWSS